MPINREGFIEAVPLPWSRTLSINELLATLPSFYVPFDPADSVSELPEPMEDRLVRGKSSQFNKTPKFAPYKHAYAGMAEADPYELISQFIERRNYSPEHKEKDLAALKKFGPQGQVPPVAQILGSLEHYYARPTLRLNHEVLTKRARMTAERYLALHGNIGPDVWSIEQVLQRYVDKGQDTRTGFPHYSHKDDLWVMNDECRLASELVAMLQCGMMPPSVPFIAGNRHQRNAIRFIFESPASLSILAGQFTTSTLQWLRNTKAETYNGFGGWAGPLALGVMANDERQAFKNAWPKALHFMSDYEKMDTSCWWHNVTSVVLEFLLVIFGLTDPETDQQRTLKSVLTYTLMQMNYSSLIVTDSLCLPEQEHGAFSGSDWIQLVETIYQQIMFEYFCSLTAVTTTKEGTSFKGTTLESYQAFITVKFLGDDAMCTFYNLPNFNVDPQEMKFLLTIPKEHLHERDHAVIASLVAPTATVVTSEDEEVVVKGTLAELHNFWAALGGLTASISKQEMSTTQRNFCKHVTRKVDKAIPVMVSGVQEYRLPGVYPVTFAFNSVVNPERTPHQWTIEQDFMRICQIIDGCVDHPHFFDLIELVSKGHPCDMFRRPDWNSPRYTMEDYYIKLSAIGQLAAVTNPKLYTWFTPDGYKAWNVKKSPTVAYLLSTLLPNKGSEYRESDRTIVSRDSALLSELD